MDDGTQVSKQASHSFPRTPSYLCSSQPSALSSPSCQPCRSGSTHLFTTTSYHNPFFFSFSYLLSPPPRPSHVRASCVWRFFSLPLSSFQSINQSIQIGQHTFFSFFLHVLGGVSGRQWGRNNNGGWGFFLAFFFSFFVKRL